MTPIPTERLEEIAACHGGRPLGEVARELLAAREALAHLIRDHDELWRFVLDATDPSNWDAARLKGEYFDGQRDARAEFHEIAAEHIDCDAVKKAAALLHQPENVAFPGRGLPQGDL